MKTKNQIPATNLSLKTLNFEWVSANAAKIELVNAGKLLSTIELGKLNTIKETLKQLKEGGYKLGVRAEEVIAA